jgi:hypothetical protein
MGRHNGIPSYLIRLSRWLHLVDDRVPTGLYSLPAWVLFFLMLLLYFDSPVIAKLYSLHIELTGFLFVATIMMASVGGLRIAQRWDLAGLLNSKNDFVTNFIAAGGIFFALVMAVIATGVWDNFKTVSEVVAKEAESAENLHRDLESYSEENRRKFQLLLTRYVERIVDIEWDLQKHGRRPEENQDLDLLSHELIAFEPKVKTEISTHSETLAELGRLHVGRHARQHSMSVALPPILWLVVFVGAALSVSMVYMLQAESKVLHCLLLFALGGLVGLVLFLILAMDHPLWGELSVSEAPFRNLLLAWSR